ncbi:acyltransferase family protein [Companilactobacillus allii]|uniref:acyltransferase family protein n=1 Tax=Companilactobacillus allii TaxID=1847728 RepID=UPI001CEFA8FC|nr:acyltransferase [Companilactobacillus allii]
MHEVDLMRVIFIGGVLLNHTTTAFKANMSDSSFSKLFLEATHLSLHFTRMGFMFMTGLVLVLNYYHRDNHWLTFWKKRYTSVGIPYLSWNAIIMLFSTVFAGSAIIWSDYWSHLVYAWLHGNEYYMYYIVVTFQLYLIFPLIIKMFKKFENHHLTILGISATLQLLITIGIKYFLPGVDRSGWPYLLNAYGLNIFTYQFYFIAGAFVAIHYGEVDAFIEKFHEAIAWTTGILALGTVGLFYFDQNVLKLSMSGTLSIHQPFIFVYDVVMIVFVFWIGRQYAHAREHGLPVWIDKVIKSLSKVSFGLYLVQSLPVLTLYGILSLFSAPSWVMLLLLPIGYAFVLGGAFLISWFCYKVPPFGILIGRPQKLKRSKFNVKNNQSIKPAIEKE